jgi:HK97 family phage major capsid protein
VKTQQVSLLKRPRIIGYRKSGAPIWLGQGAADEDPIERLEARNAELGALMEALLDEMKVEGRSESVRKEHESSWKSYEEELDKNSSQLDELRSEVKTREAREQKVRDARAKWGSQQVKSGAPEERDLFDVNLRMIGMEDPKIRKDMLSRSSRILDDDDIGGHLDDQQKRHITKLLRKQDADTDGELLAAFMIATSNPHYRSAFQKATSTLTPVFTAEEGRAVNEVNWLKRAMAIGTSASGGFAVPVVIDPTVILTAQGSTNDLLRLARVETITTDRWRGLSSAGVSWKFDTEAAPSTDNSPTIAKPEVPAYRADGFIPYSIEVGQDWPGFAEEMSRMLSLGYDELLADKLTTGSAANTPTGLIPRLVQQTAPDVSNPTITAGSIVGADVYAAWSRLPQRHRRKATTAFMSSTDVQNAIRSLGTVYNNFSVDITQEAIPHLFGKEYPMNDYMSSMPVGTAAGNLLVVGDFHGFLVAQRAGMSIEFVPMLFDVTNNRPTGQRGWFAYARVGSDVIDPTAFQLLQNKTS